MKPHWDAMLRYTAELRARSVRSALPPLPHAWEEIGPGYCVGPAFGHWDIVHSVFDALAAEKNEHAALQIDNLLHTQQPDGMLPGVFYLRNGRLKAEEGFTHPPVWPMAVDEWTAVTNDRALMERANPFLLRQIAWFERERMAAEGGFFYRDIRDRAWESGVDEGVRFDDAPNGPHACVDATAHVYLLYETAARWAKVCNEDTAPFAAKAEALQTFLQNRLFDAETGFFHDIWAVGNPPQRRLALEGMWPVVVGAATSPQAARVVSENLLNPARFFTPHPLATVAISDPTHELRMWRGPAWNSMTLWAAKGCLRYGHADAARLLLTAALDATALQFEHTGTIWEFYPPQGGEPTSVQRKPHTPFNTPCRDYLGHNPLLAMAAMAAALESG